MSIKTQTHKPAVHGPAPKPVEHKPAVVETQQVPQAPEVKPGKVDLGALGSAFVGVAREVLTAPEASQLNTNGPSQAQRMAVPEVRREGHAAAPFQKSTPGSHRAPRSRGAI